MPSTITYVGNAAVTRQVDTITITGFDAATTYRVTIANKVASVVGVTSAAETASALRAAFAAMTDAVFRELASAYTSGSSFTVTGPTDGTPFTLAVSVSGGSGTISRTATTAPSSPEDGAIAANYSGNALPTNGDTLVFERPNLSVKWGLTALAAVALAQFTRKSTWNGAIGLPDINPAGGYAEYRTKEFSVNCVSVRIEQSRQDQAQQIRLLQVSASACAFSVIGDGGGSAVGSEAVEVRGLASTSSVNASGGSVAVATAAGATATLTGVTATNATVRLGAGVTLTDISLANCQAQIDCGYTNLDVDIGGTVIVGTAAAGTNTTVDDGTISWRSSGSPGTVNIGSGGSFDASLAPAAFAVTDPVTVSGGGSLLDPAGRITRPYELAVSRARLSEVSVDVGTDRVLTVG